MNSTIRTVLVSAFAALGAFAAHADEADGSQYALSFNSTRSVAEVKAEASMPVRISNGGTGFIGVTNSARTRAAIRDEAVAALRNGRIPRGEASTM